MITSLSNTPFIEVFKQALMISNFDTVRNIFLSALASSSDFTAEQKLGIRLAGASLINPGHMPDQIDKVLMQILNMTWEDVSAEGVVSLLPEQRAGILSGVMSVCKSVIAEEAARLQNLATAETFLPEDWNGNQEAPVE